MSENHIIKKSSRALCILSASLGIILLILSTFVICVECFAFNRNFYRDEYTKLNTSLYVGVDNNTLLNATNILLDYLEGKRGDIDYQYSDGFQYKEYYSDREKAHMVDVAKLNIDAVNFAKIAFPISAVLLIFSFFVVKQPYLFFKSIFAATLFVVGFFVLIGLWATFDFEVFWVNFHKVFFTNDLWLLDPDNSLMIRMFSEKFFFDMVAGILAIFITVIAVILFVSGFMTRKYGKRH